MNTERIMELEYHHWATITVKTDSSNFSHELKFDEKQHLHSIRVSFHKLPITNNFVGNLWQSLNMVH